MTDAVRRAEPAIREVFVYKYRLQYEVGEARVLVVMKARYLADNLELDAPKRAMPPKSAAAWASGLLRLPGLPTLVDVITM